MSKVEKSLIFSLPKIVSSKDFISLLFTYNVIKLLSFSKIPDGKFISLLFFKFNVIKFVNSENISGFNSLSLLWEISKYNNLTKPENAFG